MNPNIAMGFQQPYFDPQEGQRNALAMRQAQMQEATQVMQMQQAQQAAQREGARRNALANVDYNSPDSLGQVRGVLGKQGDIDGVLAIDNHLRSLSKERREAATAELDAIPKLAGGLSNATTYRQTRAMAARVAPELYAGLPEEFDPQIVDPINRAAMSANDWRNQQNEDRNFNQRGDHYVAMENKPAAGDNTLVEIYDPNSPTGTSFVPRAQAVGKPGKPPSSMEITTADGTTIRQGRGGSGVQNSTRAAIEKETLETADGLDRLARIESLYKPEYQQLQNRWVNMKTAWKEKLNLPVSKQEKTGLEEFSKYKRQSVDNVNREISRITGAAMGVEEAGRLMKGMPNPGSSLFDGDSPTEFKTKLDSTTRDLRRALIRRNWALSQGMDPMKTGVQLSDVDAMIDTRGAEIETQLMQENPQADPSMIGAAVRDQLNREFGLR